MGFALQKDARYTVAQYLTWPGDGPRHELIDGVPYEMNAPGYDHRKLVAALHVELAVFQVIPGFAALLAHLFDWPLPMETREARAVYA